MVRVDLRRSKRSARTTSAPTFAASGARRRRSFSRLALRRAADLTLDRRPRAFRCAGSTCRRNLGGRRPDRDLRPKLFEPLGADALDALQVVDVQEQDGEGAAVPPRA